MNTNNIEVTRKTYDDRFWNSITAVHEDGELVGVKLVGK